MPWPEEYRIRAVSLKLTVFVVGALLGNNIGFGEIPSDSNPDKLQGGFAGEVDSVFRTVDVKTIRRLQEQIKDHPEPIVSITNRGVNQFLLYPNGLLIRFSEDWSEYDFVDEVYQAHKYTTLDSDEYKALMESIRSHIEFFDLDKSVYALTIAEHESRYTITVSDTSARKYVTVYGDFIHGNRMDRRGKYPERKDTPAGFRNLYHFLMNYPIDNLKLYEPPYIEVTVSDYGYAPGDSLAWPAEWPDLDSPLAKRTPGFVIEYVIGFPVDQIDELQAYLTKRRQNGAILMSGRKVSVGWGGRIFPGQKFGEWEHQKRERKAMQK